MTTRPDAPGSGPTEKQVAQNLANDIRDGSEGKVGANQRIVQDLNSINGNNHAYIKAINSDVNKDLAQYHLPSITISDSAAHGPHKVPDAPTPVTKDPAAQYKDATSTQWNTSQVHLTGVKEGNTQYGFNSDYASGVGNNVYRYQGGYTQTTGTLGVLGAVGAGGGVSGSTTSKG